jgi:hypothetical protein
MSADPIEVVGEWLQNLLDPDVVNRLVAPEAIYISLNTGARRFRSSSRSSTDR